jgi:hypothetical protein
MFALAGGARASGARHSGIIFASVPEADWKQYGSPEAFLEAHPLPVSGEVKTMAMTERLRTTSVAVQTHEAGLIRVSREAVLKYVANRKGGVHFDPGRAVPSSANPSRKRRQLEALVLDLDVLRVGSLWGYEYEVTSMVQAVSVSDWTTELVYAAHDAAPEDFGGDPNILRFFSGDASDGGGTGWASMNFRPAP